MSSTILFSLFGWIVVFGMLPMHRNRGQAKMHPPSSGIKDVHFCSYSRYFPMRHSVAAFRSSHDSDYGYKAQVPKSTEGCSDETLVVFEPVLVRRAARLCSVVYSKFVTEADYQLPKCQEWLKEGASTVLDLRDPTTKVNRMRDARVVRFVSEDNHSGYLGVIEHKDQAPNYCEWCTDPNKPSCGTDNQNFVYICFRGTNDFANALADLDSAQVAFPLWEDFPRAAAILEERGIVDNSKPLLVHQGFYGLHQALLQMRFPGNEALDSAAPKYSYYIDKMLAGTTAVITGHSLGGALAVLDALTLALCAIESGHQELKTSLKCITFGQPRVGNVAIAELVDYLVSDYFRVVNEGDPVPTVPGLLALSLRSYMPRCYCGGRRFKHAGNLVMTKPGGVFIGQPSAMEVNSGTDVSAHFMRGYEMGIELHLVARTSWLWRKAVFVARLVVKMNRMCKAKQSDQKTLHIQDDGAVLSLKGMSSDNQRSQGIVSLKLALELSSQEEFD